MTPEEREEFKNYLKTKGAPAPSDDRLYKAPDYFPSDTEFRNGIRAKYGQPLIEVKPTEQEVKEEEVEEPIHPSTALSPELLATKYPDNRYKGLTKSQLEAFEQSGDQAATSELMRRKVAELERENKATAKKYEAELQAIKDKDAEARRLAATEARIKELQVLAQLGDIGAVGEILKLRGKL